MAQVRRKSNGCRRGKFKRKKMGKGWAAHRVKRGTPKPVDRSEQKEDEAAPAAAEAS